MPEIKVIRKGITPAVRDVPTDTTLVVLPVTRERIGKEVADEYERPERIDNLKAAFEKFKPSLPFRATAGEEQTEFVADLEFRSIEDFKPENIQKRVPGKRNDLADLKNTIDL